MRGRGVIQVWHQKKFREVKPTAPRSLSWGLWGLGLASLGAWGRVAIGLYAGVLALYYKKERPIGSVGRG